MFLEVLDFFICKPKLDTNFASLGSILGKLKMLV
jgi:hypothetical protein